MNIIVLGAPGAGKGTQASIIAQKLELKKFSTGDMLRAEVASGSELGNKVQNIMNSGELVSDEIMIGVIVEQISSLDDSKGFILDGFPRTIAQAVNLDKILEEKECKVDCVLAFDVDFDVLVERLAGRIYCKDCGTTFHEVFSPPKQGGICDNCGSVNLVRRDDDKREVVTARLNKYLEMTEPLINYYQDKKNLIIVNGDNDVAKVTQEILKKIELINA